jgi:hypothetical protein
VASWRVAADLDTGRVYYPTTVEAAATVIRSGFPSASGSSNIRVSTSPSDESQGASEVLVEVEFPASELVRWAVVSETTPGRVFVVPADILNCHKRLLVGWYEPEALFRARFMSPPS